MKRHSLLTFTTGLALSAFAAEPTIVDDISYAVIPSIVTSTSGAQDFLVTKQYNDYDENFVVVYDSNLTQVANITLPKGREVTLQYWTQEREQRPKDMTLIDTYITEDILVIDGKDTGITLTQALDYIKSYYDPANVETATIDGETAICVEYARSEYFGKTYPTVYYKLINDRWTRINCTYEDGELGPFGEWGEVHSVTKTERIGLGLRNPDLSCSNGQFDGVVVTQTFFNNDNKFEYIVTEYDVEEYTEEQDGYRTGGERIAIKGFQIRNEDGATLHTIALPAEYQSESSDHSVELLIISGKKYIAIETYHNGMYHTLFYQVSELGTIKAPITIKGSLKVRPAVSRRGESVTVEIGEEAQPGCTMSVIGIDGHEVQRVKVAAGSTSTKLNTGALTSGAYIVTVTNGNTRRETAKIIVR